MKSKLENRWYESITTTASMRKIKALLEYGGELTNDFTPFGLTDANLADFRGLNLSELNIRNVEIRNADFSYSQFCNARIKKSVFENVKYEKVDLTNCTELSNQFSNVEFINCKFNYGGIGCDGSIYKYCIFTKSSFTKTSFVRGEFNNVRFADCKLRGVDFYSSSFENCVFIGKLENVWFRGGYSNPSNEEIYGNARQNKMLNVSFEDAILDGANFSNECDLSTIILPKTGNHILFDNWARRLEYLNFKIVDWEKTEKFEAEVFIFSHSAHAVTQDMFIINTNELQRRYGSDVAAKIIFELTQLGVG